MRAKQIRESMSEKFTPEIALKVATEPAPLVVPKAALKGAPKAAKKIPPEFLPLKFPQPEFGFAPEFGNAFSDIP